GVPSGPLTQIILTAAMTGLFIFSTVSGLKKGMKFLSSLNMVLALVLTIFIMAVVPFTFIMESIVLGLGDYLTNFVGYSLRMQPYSEGSWVQEWTVFYWAWVIAWRDRKSTRLNSSHVSISYAVFCLKKKKKHMRSYA